MSYTDCEMLLLHFVVMFSHPAMSDILNSLSIKGKDIMSWYVINLNTMLRAKRNKENSFAERDEIPYKGLYGRALDFSMVLKFIQLIS